MMTTSSGRTWGRSSTLASIQWTRRYKSQIEALRDSGKIVHLYGTLLSNVPDYNGSQIQVDRIEEQASGGYMPPGTSEEIADWWGVIKSTSPAHSMMTTLSGRTWGRSSTLASIQWTRRYKSQIEALRDSGKIVHLYGTLLSNVPDYNGSQVLVDRIEVEG